MKVVSFISLRAIFVFLIGIWKTETSPLLSDLFSHHVKIKGHEGPFVAKTSEELTKECEAEEKTQYLKTSGVIEEGDIEVTELFDQLRSGKKSDFWTHTEYHWENNTVPYTISSSSSLKKHENPACEGIIDIGFMLDSSNSLENDYNHEKEFIKKLASKFGISHNGSHAALVAFSQIATINIKLNDFFEISTFNAAVDRVPHINGDSRIGLGLRTALEIFEDHNGARNNIPKLLFMLINSEQIKNDETENPLNVANEIRNKGVDIITIGIGKSTNHEKLMSIAGSKGNLFLAKEFKDLIVNDFVNKVKAGSCFSGDIRKETQLQKDNLIATLPTVEKEFKISFEMKTNSYSAGYHSVFKLDLGNGLFIAIYFTEDGHGTLAVASFISTSISEEIKSETQINLNRWVAVKISQQLYSGIYIYAVEVAGKTLLSKVNSNVQDFNSVSVYASDPDNLAQAGSIRNLKIKNGNEGFLVKQQSPLKKGALIATLPKLEKEYVLSLDIQPEDFPDIYHNIIQLASGNDNFGVSNNNPAIWLHKGANGKLNLAALIKSKHVVLNKMSLDLNYWSRITISQQLISGSYIYSITVNDTEVYSEKKDFPIELDIVKVYAGSPDDVTQQGLIRNFYASNGNKAEKSPEKTCEQISDVVMLIESFASKQEDIHTEKTFLKKFARTFEVTNDGSHLGLISFNADAKINLKITDNQVASSIDKSIDSIQFVNKQLDSQGSGLSTALHLAHEEFFSQPDKDKDRIDDVPKVLVLISTGEQEDDELCERYKALLHSMDSMNPCKNHKLKNNLLNEGVDKYHTQGQNFKLGYNGGRTIHETKMNTHEKLYGKKIFEEKKNKIENRYRTNRFQRSGVSERKSLSNFFIQKMKKNNEINYLKKYWANEENGYGQIGVKRGYAPVGVKPGNAQMGGKLGYGKFGVQPEYGQAFKKTLEGIDKFKFGNKIIDPKLSIQSGNKPGVSSYQSDMKSSTDVSGKMQLSNNFATPGFLNQNTKPKLSESQGKPQHNNDVPQLSPPAQSSHHIGKPQSYDDNQLSMEKSSGSIGNLYSTHEIGKIKFTDNHGNQQFNNKGNQFGNLHDTLTPHLGLKSPESFGITHISDKLHSDSNKLASLAFKMRNKGVIIVAIGIGPGVDKKKLSDIAGSSDKVLVANKMQDILEKDFLDKVKKASCSEDARAERLLDNGKLLTVLRKISKEYSIVFELKPSNFTSGLQSVLHLVEDNGNGLPGKIFLAIWFNGKSGNLVVSSDVSGYKGFHFIYDKTVVVNVWTEVSISQFKYGDLEYVYEIKINGKQVHSIMNEGAQEFTNINVYASDPFNPPLSGSIRNFVFTNGVKGHVIHKETPLESGKLLTTLPKLELEYQICFEIKPEISKSFQNVLQIMQAEHKNNKYGLEKLAIWLDDELTGRVTSGINDDFHVNFKKSLTLQTWANIRISQQLMHNKYLFEVELNGNEVISVENPNPKEFVNLKVYASSPLYESVSASIRNVIVTNGHEDIELRKVVRSAITDFHDFTSVRFVHRHEEPDYLSFYPTEGCYSKIGKAGGEQIISVGPECRWKGTVIHLIMHALGFLHETSRVDRDVHLKVSYENMHQRSITNFKKYNAGQEMGLLYDYFSIMHYRALAFSKNRFPTLTSLHPNIKGDYLGQRNGFSETDIKRIHKVYPPRLGFEIDKFKYPEHPDHQVDHPGHPSYPGQQDHSKPSKDTDKPGDHPKHPDHPDHPKPSKDTDKPGDHPKHPDQPDHLQPGKDTDKPGDHHERPDQPGHPQPGKDADKPGDHPKHPDQPNHLQPGKDTDKPGDYHERPDQPGHPQPGKETDKPGDYHESPDQPIHPHPGKDTDKPADHPKHPDQPDHLQPGKDADKPGDYHERPDQPGHPQPGKDTDKPSDYHESPDQPSHPQPGKDLDKPGDYHESPDQPSHLQPGKDADKPGDHSKHPDQPNHPLPGKETDKPGDHSNHPDHPDHPKPGKDTDKTGDYHESPDQPSHPQPGKDADKPGDYHERPDQPSHPQPGKDTDKPTDHPKHPDQPDHIQPGKDADKPGDYHESPDQPSHPQPGKDADKPGDYHESPDQPSLIMSTTELPTLEPTSSIEPISLPVSNSLFKQIHPSRLPVRTTPVTIPDGNHNTISTVYPIIPTMNLIIESLFSTKTPAIMIPTISPHLNVPTTKPIFVESDHSVAVTTPSILKSTLTPPPNVTHISGVPSFDILISSSGSKNCGNNFPCWPTDYSLSHAVQPCCTNQSSANKCNCHCIFLNMLIQLEGHHKPTFLCHKRTIRNPGFIITDKGKHSDKRCLQLPIDLSKSRRFLCYSRASGYKLGWSDNLRDNKCIQSNAISKKLCLF